MILRRYAQLSSSAGPAGVCCLIMHRGVDLAATALAAMRVSGNRIVAIPPCRLMPGTASPSRRRLSVARPSSAGRPPTSEAAGAVSAALAWCPTMVMPGPLYAGLCRLQYRGQPGEAKGNCIDAVCRATSRLFCRGPDLMLDMSERASELRFLSDTGRRWASCSCR